MFGHIFCYKTRELFRQKWCLGWNLLFPLVLATAFSVGFGRFITDENVLQTVNVAVVAPQEDAYSQSFVELVRGLDFMHVTVVPEEKAQMLLKNGEASGILYAPSQKSGNAVQEGAEPAVAEWTEPSLTVSGNGIDQTILSQFLKSYLAHEKEMEEIFSYTQDPADIQKASDLLEEDMSFGSSDVDLRYARDGGKLLSPYMHYFFALIAMASLFASWISTSILDEIMASHTEIGKRYECAPVPKAVSLTASVFAGLLTQLICVTCLIFYIQYALGMDFQAPLACVILLSAACSVTGISFGVMFGALFGTNPAASTAIPLLFSMTCSFLSGLMVGNLQQIIQVYAPWVNRINPAALLSDGLDSLCSYGIGPAYWLDLLLLLILAAAAIAVSSLVLRRKNYAAL